MADAIAHIQYIVAIYSYLTTWAQITFCCGRITCLLPKTVEPETLPYYRHSSQFAVFVLLVVLPPKTAVPEAVTVSLKLIIAGSVLLELAG